MKVLVIGATGGSGRAAIEHLLAQGHEVTAFTRRPGSIEAEPGRLRVATGDAMDRNDVERAVQGHDAVVVTLGITENPLRVRLRGAARTADNVRSAGTRNVIAAMQKHGVRRLVVQSSHGAGETRRMLGFADRLFFRIVLGQQITDTNRQEQIVRASGLDWVIARPVHLTDGHEDAMPLLSAKGETGGTKLSRRSVGRFLADAVQGQAFVGQAVSLSRA